MTKIQTPVLTRKSSDSYSLWVKDENESWFFCGSQLREVFGDFPKCGQIQLVAHDEPGPDRIEIKIVKSTDGTDIDDVLVKGESETRIVDQSSMQSFKKLAKRHRRWWVTLYYWE